MEGEDAEAAERGDTGSVKTGGVIVIIIGAKQTRFAFDIEIVNGGAGA